jgi:hypothetical protein
LTSVFSVFKFTEKILENQEQFEKNTKLEDSYYLTHSISTVIKTALYWCKESQS